LLEKCPTNFDYSGGEPGRRFIFLHATGYLLEELTHASGSSESHVESQLTESAWQILPEPKHNISFGTRAAIFRLGGSFPNYRQEPLR
jgi:hypothetical protein